MASRQFPDGLPAWLRKPTEMDEYLEFYKDSMDPEVGWHGPSSPAECMDQNEADTYISHERNVELIVSRHDDPLDREDGAHDCGKFTLSYGPGLAPPNADHHFSSEEWESVLEKMSEWGPLSPG